MSGRSVMKVHPKRGCGKRLKDPERSVCECDWARQGACRRRRLAPLAPEVQSNLQADQHAHRPSSVLRHQFPSAFVRLIFRFETPRRSCSNPFSIANPSFRCHIMNDIRSCGARRKSVVMETPIPKCGRDEEKTTKLDISSFLLVLSSERAAWESAGVERHDAGSKSLTLGQLGLTTGWLAEHGGAVAALNNGGGVGEDGAACQRCSCSRPALIRVSSPCPCELSSTRHAS